MLILGTESIRTEFQHRFKQGSAGINSSTWGQKQVSEYFLHVNVHVDLNYSRLSKEYKLLNSWTIQFFTARRIKRQFTLLLLSSKVKYGMSKIFTGKSLVYRGYSGKWQILRSNSYIYMFGIHINLFDINLPVLNRWSKINHFDRVNKQPVSSILDKVYERTFNQPSKPIMHFRV